MRVARVRIRNFRCIREAEIHPSEHNVFLGPNNSGKTAVLEAVNLVLNPEITFRAHAVDENDFYRRDYLPELKPDPGDDSTEVDATDQTQEGVDGNGATLAPDNQETEATDSEASYPTIYIELVLSGLSEEDEDFFSDNIVPWSARNQIVVEQVDEGTDPFESAESAIRVFFEGWFEPGEDDFFHDTFFLPAEGLGRDECPRFGREAKRHIGFLIYRDFRALTRPVTLEARSLFGRLVASQEAKPRRFEDVLRGTENALSALRDDDGFASLLNSYKAELERFLPLTTASTSNLTFDLTDRTRAELKANAQLYTWDSLPMPLQKMGAGTRSLAILAILTLIVRRRGRGILALEEPETFLFPHAQRRVLDECTSLADQTFVTTHSPFVLERVPIDGVGRLSRDEDGAVSWSPLATDSVKKTNLYSRFLRRAHCEALVGRGVLLVEGDSDRWWASGASRILDRKTVFDRRQEALELQGVAVAGADGFGEIIRLGNFFSEAGLPVVALLDKLETADLPAEADTAPFPILFHAYKGLEGLLARELSVEKLRIFLKGAPHGKGLPLDTAAVDAMTEPEVRTTAQAQLSANKGSAFMHEWILSQLEAGDLPQTLLRALDLIGRHFAEEASLGTASILSG